MSQVESAPEGMEGSEVEPAASDEMAPGSSTVAPEIRPKSLPTTDERMGIRPTLLQMTGDVEAGLRFVHQMEVQGRIEQSQLAAELSALTDLLIAKGLISAREFNERRDRAAAEQAKREEGQAFPTLSGVADKYTSPTVELPCQEILHICQGACCKFTLSLSLQDLDEGVVRWNYGYPYQIRRDPVLDRCVHFVPGKGCGIYEYRPAVCRGYDCREDKRVWKDFEKRILADAADAGPSDQPSSTQ